MQETLPCPHVHGRLGDLAGGGFVSSVAREAGDGHGGHGRIASDFGLQLDLAPGKTEAVVSWVPKAPHVTFGQPARSDASTRDALG